MAWQTRRLGQAMQCDTSLPPQLRALSLHGTQPLIA
jgi:hypothetical protein